MGATEFNNSLLKSLDAEVIARLSLTRLCLRLDMRSSSQVQPLSTSSLLRKEWRR